MDERGNIIRVLPPMRPYSGFLLRYATNPWNGDFLASKNVTVTINISIAESSLFPHHFLHVPVRSIPFAQVATGFRISSDARDSGIQIFDKFYALILSESDSEKLSQHSARSTLVNNENVLLNCGLRKSLLEEYSEPDSQLDPNIVSYAAAVSIILGSKLHESNGELTLVS